MRWQALSDILGKPHDHWLDDAGLTRDEAQRLLRSRFRPFWRRRGPEKTETIMPASAPLRVMRRQNSDRISTGPKAVPKPPRA